jgi:AcrR family transcriptional regulator
VEAPAPEKVGRRERNKADKRRRIVAAATRLFEERGFEATTTAAIADEAGIGAGTLYLYVDSKEDLLVAVFREEVGRAWDSAFAQVDPTQPVVEQVLSAFGHVTSYHEHDPGLARAFFKELLFVSESARPAVSDFMRAFFEQLHTLLEEAQRRDLLDPEVPVRGLADNLFASWYLLMQRRHTGALSEEGLRRRLDTSFRVALHGITPSSRPMAPAEAAP